MSTKIIRCSLFWANSSSLPTLFCPRPTLPSMIYHLVSDLSHFNHFNSIIKIILLCVKHFVEPSWWKIFSKFNCILDFHGFLPVSDKACSAFYLQRKDKVKNCMTGNLFQSATLISILFNSLPLSSPFSLPFIVLNCLWLLPYLYPPLPQTPQTSNNLAPLCVLVHRCVSTHGRVNIRSTCWPFPLPITQSDWEHRKNIPHRTHIIL